MTIPLIRWHVVLGRGLKTMDYWPLTPTKGEAELKALQTYPGWSVISVEKHIEIKREVGDET